MNDAICHSRYVWYIHLISIGQVQFEIESSKCLNKNFFFRRFSGMAMQQELVDFYQLLYHVTPVVTFQVKSWPHSTFCIVVDSELVSTLWKNNRVFYLVIIESFLNFPPIPWIGSAERIHGIGENSIQFSLLKS